MIVKTRKEVNKMAFICEKISEKDRDYFNSIGFTYMLGEPSEARWWAFDRDRGIAFVCRGGLPYERFKGYQLCFKNQIIDIEAIEEKVGNRFCSNLQVHWIVNKVEIPTELLSISEDAIKQIIREAFISYASRNIENSKVQDVRVSINAKIENK